MTKEVTKLEKQKHSSGYKVLLEETDRIAIFECYGEKFPLHPEEWAEYDSLWQEDYFRFVLQKDIQLLTIHYARYHEDILWKANTYMFTSIHDVYKHLNESLDPFLGSIYGDMSFHDNFYEDRDGRTENDTLELIRRDFNKAYEYYCRDLNNYIYSWGLGIVYFDGSFSEGNETRAVYEYMDTHTMAIEIDMSNKVIRFWDHPEKRVCWEDVFYWESYKSELLIRLKNRYFPLLDLSQLQVEFK